MAEIAKSQALQILESLIAEIPALRLRSPDTPEFNEWFQRTLAMLNGIFGDGANEELQVKVLVFRSTLLDSWEGADHRAYMRGLQQAEAILKGYVSHIENFWHDSDGEVRTTPSDQDALARVLQICDRFHHVAIRLANRRTPRIPLSLNDEFDVQYLLRALLAVEFDDVRPEDYAPQRAGASSRVDFLIKKHKIVIEAKMTRRGLKDKEVGDKLLVDIGRYRGHPACGHLICLVYDLHHFLVNPTGLEADLRGSTELDVHIKVTPGG